MPRRILLLFPQLNNLVFFGVFEPLVLEIFSAIAKEEGCETELIDLRLEPDGCERLAAAGYQPDLVAVTTHGFPEVPIVNGIVNRCRRLWPAAAVVIGGGQATVSPELFDLPAIDLIVRGPGERLWRDICRTGVERGPCRIVSDPHPPKVYSYPLPDRAITRKYRHRYVTNIPHHAGGRFGVNGRTAFTLLTQGCPFRCSFCVIWRANLGMFRKRPIPEIVAEFQDIEEDFVYLGDDNTFADPRYADTLADALLASGVRKEISSYCRADHICDHPDLMRKWHRVGLRYLVIGIEAVSSDTLQRFNKKTEADQNTRALAILREIGIHPIPHMIVSPDMREEDFAAISEYIEDNRFEYPVVIPLTPLPGTDDYERYDGEGRLLSRDLRFYTFMYNVVRPRHMSPQAFDGLYDRLVLRMWGWQRYLSGRCGDTSFLAFMKWWLFVRVLLLQLRWKRRALYDEARRDPSAVAANRRRQASFAVSPGVVPGPSRADT